ncbi:hypothetical protein HYU11_04580 [Candidatus Woesearchaeota archaeon]|nr:hypothetical protein [Candidatus Woesearchaeota archaeon]
MQLFKKKKEEAQEDSLSDKDISIEDVPIAHSDTEAPKAVTNVDRLGLDLEKLKNQFASFYEMNKAVSERFARVNEQIGELRAMIIDMDRAKQHLEAKATQAIDIVESVQPEKLMVELRKEDAKVEGVRATIDSHEAMINNILSELKDLRNKLSSLRGLEEVVKMSEQVKGDLVEMRKMQVLIQRHSDRVETIFAEMSKNFGELNRFRDVTNDLNTSFKKLSSDVDNLSVKIDTLSSKKEVTELMGKFSVFEKRTGSIVEMMNSRIDTAERKMAADMDSRIKEVNALLAGFKSLAGKNADFGKVLGMMSEEGGRAGGVKVEKLKEMGQSEVSVPESDQGSKGIVGKLFKRGG